MSNTIKGQASAGVTPSQTLDAVTASRKLAAGVENGATTPGSTVTYFPQEYTTLGNEHLWLRGKADKNGYFTFQNPASGLFLTCVNAFNTKIESKSFLQSSIKLLAKI